MTNSVLSVILISKKIDENEIIQIIKIPWELKLMIFGEKEKK